MCMVYMAVEAATAHETHNLCIENNVSNRFYKKMFVCLAKLIHAHA